jgi:hypothetical protein
VTEEAHKTPPVQMADAPPPPPVVTPDQVTESNAVEMAQALSRELDQELAVPATTEAQPSAMKP